MNQKTLLWVVVGVVVLAGLMLMMSSTPTSAPDDMDDSGAAGTVEEGSEDAEDFDDTDGTTGIEDAGDRVVIDITGENFAFSQDEIRVNVGDTVTINFESVMGFHDWVVDEFDAATEQVNAGGTTSVTFVADEAGEFEYYCSVGMHRALGMAGTLIVE